MSVQSAEVNVETGFPYDNLLFELVKAKDVISDGEYKRIVTGFAAVAEVIDSQFELITREALEGAAKDLLQYTTVLYNHDPDRPIGKVLEARPENGGLFVKVLISNTEDEIWDKITEGVISKFSFRGVVTDYEERFEKSLNRYITIIKGFRIFEISLVSVPANPHARTLYHYLSKARGLHEASKTLVEPTPNRGGSMAEMEEVKKEEQLQPAQAGKEGLKAIVQLCDKLISALQHLDTDVDPRLVSLARGIKHLAMKELGEEYPYPYPQPNMEQSMDLENFDPVTEKMHERMKSVEEKLRSLEESMSQLAGNVLNQAMESMKEAASQLIDEKIKDLDLKIAAQAELIEMVAKVLDELRPVVGLPSQSETRETGGETVNG